MMEEIEARDEQARQIYEYISANADNDDLSDLVKMMPEAMAIYPDHPSGLLVRTRLAARVRRFADAIEAAIRARGQGQWEAAIARLQDARAANPGSARTARAIDDLTLAVQERREMRERIEAAIREGNSSKALTLARALDRYIEQIERAADTTQT